VDVGPDSSFLGADVELQVGVRVGSQRLDGRFPPRRSGGIAARVKEPAGLPGGAAIMNDAGLALMTRMMSVAAAPGGVPSPGGSPAPALSCKPVCPGKRGPTWSAESSAGLGARRPDGYQKAACGRSWPDVTSHAWPTRIFTMRLSPRVASAVGERHAS
jgi:hypothetical protein